MLRSAASSGHSRNCRDVHFCSGFSGRICRTLGRNQAKLTDACTGTLFGAVLSIICTYECILFHGFLVETESSVLLKHSLFNVVINILCIVLTAQKRWTLTSRLKSEAMQNDFLKSDLVVHLKISTE